MFGVGGGGGKGSDLVEESGSCQDHGELTGVVGIVEPGLMVDVPRVIPPRETHDAVSGFTPHSVRHRPTQSQPDSSFSANESRLKVNESRLTVQN